MSLDKTYVTETSFIRSKHTWLNYLTNMITSFFSSSDTFSPSGLSDATAVSSAAYSNKVSRLFLIKYKKLNSSKQKINEKLTTLRLCAL